MKHNNEEEKSEPSERRWGESIDKEKKNEFQEDTSGKLNPVGKCLCAKCSFENAKESVRDNSCRSVCGLIFSARDRTRLSVEKEGSRSRHFPLEESGSGLSCAVRNRKHSGYYVAKPSRRLKVESEPTVKGISSSPATLRAGGAEGVVCAASLMTRLPRFLTLEQLIVRGRYPPPAPRGAAWP